MIKRFTFVDRAPDVGAEAFVDGWTQEVADQLAAAPDDLRPTRVALGSTAPDLGRPDPRHDAVVVEWFADADGATRWDGWITAHGAHGAGGPADERRRPASGDRGPVVVVADELVLRGADWLAQRWIDGGAKLKHMALAQRAVGTTPAEFSQRWRHHAGQVGPAAGATAIPEAVRGRAYVQNHPLSRPAGDWAYDAVNEVYFDDVEGLARRVAWFGENRIGERPDDLTGASWFLAVREEIVLPSS